MTKQQRYFAKSFVIHALAVLSMIPIVFPVYWLVVSALQNPDSIISVPPKLFPANFSLHYLTSVFAEFNIARYLFNSVFLTVISVLCVLAVSCIAAFSYIAYRFKLRETFSKLVLFVYMFPQILIIVPLYILMSRIGLINTYPGLILCYMAFEMPICIWTMQSYFETIPRDIIDAAEIDGLPRIKTLWYVFLPVALPGMSASGIMTFIGIWNNFLLANTLLVKIESKTLPVVIADFASRSTAQQGVILASSLVICIPSFIFALFAQKYLVGGLTAGAVKA
ncbi:MAG: carbohydrate ABC transporter permease [Spirochaetaceae bacterium]|jgi:multiple sugar transport system permease protein|nr:carbohydrate ABC transporter permease [Spirochaetaceae bacterium]